jgi:hypothetical protein
MLRLLQNAASYSHFQSDRFVQVLALQQITRQLVTGIAATARVWNPVLREHGQSEEAPGILRLESLKAFYCAFIVAFGKRDWSLGSPFFIMRPTSVRSCCSAAGYTMLVSNSNSQRTLPPFAVTVDQWHS